MGDPCSQLVLNELFTAKVKFMEVNLATALLTGRRFFMESYHVISMAIWAIWMCFYQKRPLDLDCHLSTVAIFQNISRL